MSPGQQRRSDGVPLPARIGTWLEAWPEVLQVTRTMVFGQYPVLADGEAVLRAGGTFRYTDAPDPRFDRIRRPLAAHNPEESNP